jgi:hypothetical protein
MAVEAQQPVLATEVGPHTQEKQPEQKAYEEQTKGNNPVDENPDNSICTAAAECKSNPDCCPAPSRCSGVSANLPDAECNAWRELYFNLDAPEPEKETSSLDADVLGHSHRKDARGKEFTVYETQVTSPEGTYSVAKRYSQFKALHSTIKKEISGVSFPPKTLFGSVNTTKRCEDLKMFVKVICSEPMTDESLLKLSDFLAEEPAVAETSEATAVEGSSDEEDPEPNETAKETVGAETEENAAVASDAAIESPAAAADTPALTMEFRVHFFGGGLR